MAELSDKARSVLERYRRIESLREREKAQLFEGVRTRTIRGDLPILDVDSLPRSLPGAKLPSSVWGSPLGKILLALGVSGATVVSLVIFSQSSPPVATQGNDTATAAQTTEPPPPVSAAEQAATKPSSLAVSRANSSPKPEPQSDRARTATLSPGQGENRAPARVPQQGTIDEEVVLLKRTRTALNTGDAALALELLDEHARRFPKSRLSDAREVTRMLALCNSGQAAAARRSAERFLARNPDSPFADRVARICEQTQEIALLLSSRPSEALYRQNSSVAGEQPALGSI